MPMPTYNGKALVNGKEISVIITTEERDNSKWKWGKFFAARCEGSGIVVATSADSEQEALRKMEGHPHYIRIEG